MPLSTRLSICVAAAALLGAAGFAIPASAAAVAGGGPGTYLGYDGQRHPCP